tara:strand:+ start:207 stop:404 length:198 start_codon:yes stop_codon:yes gene_type:complete
MFQLNNKIASVLLESLTLEELEAMVEQKKQINKQISAPLKLTEEEMIKNYCREFLLKKLYPPKYK